MQSQVLFVPGPEISSPKYISQLSHPTFSLFLAGDEIARSVY